ncbi:MAG: outer membrane beta-barrel protein [Planctomycetia bacterium]|nr:outer membrane beta-barrel protein [Planctomycetia bacterium]
MRTRISLPLLGIMLIAALSFSYGEEKGKTKIAGQQEQACAACYGNEAVALGDQTACTSCGSCYCGQSNSLIPCCYKRAGRFYYDGWITVGATSFDQPPITTIPAPSEVDRGSDGASQIQMNQLYMILGIDQERGGNLSIGGRVDLLYGADYLYTSSIGLETKSKSWAGYPTETVYGAATKWNRNSRGGFSEYGLALPQAYAEIYAPLMEGLSVKVGHYYSPVGYESVMSPSNFFYTHSYSMLYGEAQTLTGVLANLKLNRNWSLIGGVDQGWNTWDDIANTVSWLTGFKWQNDCKTSSLAFTLMNGDQVVATGANSIVNNQPNYGTLKGNSTNYSLVYQQKLTPALQYVFQHDLGYVENGSYWDELGWTGLSKNLENANWYSIVNYLFYQINENLAIGGRFEWFKDEGFRQYYSQATRLTTPFSTLGYQVQGDNMFNVALGLNWKPTPWMTVRPEIRYDWADFEVVNPATGQVLSKGLYDGYSKKDIVTVSGDVVIRF